MSFFFFFFFFFLIEQLQNSREDFHILPEQGWAVSHLLSKESDIDPMYDTTRIVLNCLCIEKTPCTSTEGASTSTDAASSTSSEAASSTSSEAASSTSYCV